MLSRVCLLAVSLLGLALTPLTAAAQLAPKEDASYFAVKLGLGLGGSRKVTSNSVTIGTNTISASNAAILERDDLAVTFGLAGQYMLPLHKYFVLGGLLGVSSWQSTTAGKDERSRNLMFDLALVPQGRLPLAGLLELYVALPIGLALDAWNEVKSGVNVGGLVGLSTEANTAVGFSIGLLLGARMALVDNFGALMELGYVHRAFSHEVTARVTGLPPTTLDASLSFGQFAWNLGVFF